MAQMGYVFAIHDPLKKEARKKEREAGHPDDIASHRTKDIIYVGFARVPWLSVQRLILEPPNQAFKEHLEKVYAVSPKGLTIPGVEVTHVYFGDLLDLPYDVLEPDSEGRLYIEWTILSEVSVEQVVTQMEHEEEGRPVVDQNPKLRWIHRLQQEGHTLFNRLPGRPKGSTTMKRKSVVTSGGS